jgi:hypothetical protein
VKRFIGILDYSDATHSLDCLHTGGPIVEVAAEYDADCATTV